MYGKVHGLPCTGAVGQARLGLVITTVGSRQRFQMLAAMTSGPLRKPGMGNTFEMTAKSIRQRCAVEVAQKYSGSPESTALISTENGPSGKAIDLSASLPGQARTKRVRRDSHAL